MATTKSVGAYAGVGQSAVGRARRPHGSGDGAGGCDTLGPAQRRQVQCKANLTICQRFEWGSEKKCESPQPARMIALAPDQCLPASLPSVPSTGRSNVSN